MSEREAELDRLRSAIRKARYAAIICGDLPGYDDWKTHNPDDDRCEFCGAHPRECRGGWEPDDCTGECQIVWRDPDAEYDAMRDDPPPPFSEDDF